MRNQWGLRLRRIFLSLFTFAATSTCLGASNITVGCPEHERLALIKFKYSVKDDFKMLSSWVGVDCCSWEGVRCDRVTGNIVSLHLRGNLSTPYSCNTPNGRSFASVVEEHDLDGADYHLVLEGINSSLAELRHLKHLDLSGNDFQGSHIPKFTGSLTQLSYLNLSNAGLSGNVPHDIGNLSNLEVLDLNSLSYSQELRADDISWISGLSSLEHLNLNGVDLNRAQNRDVVLYMIPSLLELSLSCCGFLNSDLIPSHLNTSRMLPNIRHLDLSWNTFQGSFPSLITNMSSLLALDLSGNLINSSIHVMPSLRRLDLSDNSIGKIEHIGIWRQCHLKQLSMPGNYFGDKMIGPSTNIAKCTHYDMELLDLSGTGLHGLIPESLGRMTSLRVLYLGSNKLEGYNQLAGPIPIFLERLGSLQTFSVSSNLLNRTIPDSVGLLTKLDLLDVSNNSLGGVVNEAHFSNLSVLKYLDLSSNRKLRFNVSREWIPPFQLRTIRLGSCKISDEFPTWLQNQKELDELILSNTSITGSLPACGPLVNLPFGDPLNGFKDENYGSLYLQNNLFNGFIPKLLCRRTGLEYLDLSRNRLTGNIPNCLVKLQNLRMMIFSSNRLSGIIPNSLGYMSPILSWLNLNDNNLIGEVPNCFGELYGMVEASQRDIRNGSSSFNENVIQVLKGVDLEYSKTLGLVFNMDLSSNKLTGEIPQELTALTLLVGLNLSHNHLSGGIPDSLGNMKALNSLDFSDNQLTGMIPPSITALNFLSHLNLSHNNLSGRIPTGNQLQTLTDPSIYAGNRDLCGTPLEKNCSNHEDPTNTINKNKNDTDDELELWFYLAIVCGLAVGFWGVIGVLLFKKQWRHNLFMFAEVNMDKIYVAVAVKVYKMK
ncbi:leucine-rich repeat protein [Artemisia annua]|uniref:Leucine-rich repeat protein n=1 Tax=Artemisia annua TaxID=35608 RepID=A0A2U1Q9L8_ARTAN|nr:leucine-rich repeat protein [Artemisia annua]